VKDRKGESQTGRSSTTPGRVDGEIPVVILERI
jgi:hypothetical protein